MRLIKITLIIFIGLLLFLAVSFAGLLAGNWYGEAVNKNAEPLIETLFGGVFGIAMGIALAVLGAAFAIRRVK